jgi:hypothetical protein
LGSLVRGRLALNSDPDVAAQEHAVLGQGNVPCGSWLNDRKGDDTNASSKIAWVLGYVTAFNQYESKPAGDVSGGKGTEEIMVWIDNYCDQHPSDNLYRASASLVDDSDISSDASSDYGQDRVAYCRFRGHHPPSHPSPQKPFPLHKTPFQKRAVSEVDHAPAARNFAAFVLGPEGSHRSRTLKVERHLDNQPPCEKIGKGESVDLFADQ